MHFPTIDVNLNPWSLQSVKVMSNICSTIVCDVLHGDSTVFSNSFNVYVPTLEVIMITIANVAFLNLEFVNGG